MFFGSILHNIEDTYGSHCLVVPLATSNVAINLIANATANFAINVVANIVAMPMLPDILLDPRYA